MDNEKQRKSNTVLFTLLIFSVGCALRLIGLGSSSLTLNEAENALAALRLFSGESSGQMLYTLPTALVFKMFGDSDFTARLFPALTGIMLVLLPVTIRRCFGSRKMLLLSLFFAVDPVLLFWSKRADAVIPAIALAAAAVTFILNSKPAAGCACLLIALSGGERSLPALIVLSVCGAVYCFLRKADLPKIPSVNFGKRDLAAAAVIFLPAVTVFSAYPSGLGVFCKGIINAFKPAADWARPGVAATVIAILVYSAIPLLLFLANNSIRYRRTAFCGLALFGSLLLILWMGIPALPWISVILWCGSLSLVSGMIDSLQGQKGFPFYLTACAVIGSFSFFYFRLVEVFNQQNGAEPVRISWNGTEQMLPLTRVGASVLLTLASVLIIGLILKILLGFFDSVIVRHGILLGCIVICSWGLVTNIWNVGGFDRIGDHPASFHPENSRNLLNGNYTSLTRTPLFEIIDEIEAKHGDRPRKSFGLDLITDDMILEWYLRKTDGLVRTGNPQTDLTDIEMVLADPHSSYEANGFVGTVLTYRAKTDWSDYNIQEWGKWLLFGDGKNSAETSLIIWAKGDMIYSGEE